MIAQLGITGYELNRADPHPRRLCNLFVRYGMTLAEINPLAQLDDGSFIAVDAHMDMENEARPHQQKLLKDLGVGDEETRAGARGRPSSRSRASRSTPSTTAASPATSPSSTATSAS